MYCILLVGRTVKTQCKEYRYEAVRRVGAHKAISCCSQEGWCCSDWSSWGRFGGRGDMKGRQDLGKRISMSKVLADNYYPFVFPFLLSALLHPALSLGGRPPRNCMKSLCKASKMYSLALSALSCYESQVQFLPNEKQFHLQKNICGVTYGFQLIGKMYENCPGKRTLCMCLCVYQSFMKPEKKKA